MKILGLTGSIGMGKSTVAAMFRAEGVPVFDADAEVHRLQGPGSPLLPEIEALHPGTTHPDRGVDRAALRKAVWGNDEALGRLEHILYPALHKVRRRFLLRHRARPLVVLDIPLLFEKGGWRKVDAIAVVSAPAWVQRRRVLARPGMTAGQLGHILSLQTPDAEKRRRADFIIDTGGTLTVTRAQVRRVIACLSRSGGR
ncbi:MULTISPECIES: dephospho-CoA kinase [Sphingomonadales]|uniref:Dephospho-CoA kinase n=2 Tax=Edaphosphingomonas TaxID=3423724 RepID=A0A2T4I8L4_9SPHN|nr:MULTISPECIES: dephospho-CoA kinase [Sphingomonas]AGH49769.1 dephospho-CoA kinase [Sphingomonas sp. MM-1]MDX3885767.1 dephospho-CoA kinase [Sphingomonas sp.]OHT18084.1 Dephospho-CoA kinase [Sphingomonas haloaromaticamans]PTD28103.1 dephospho-CoA kinase [Sphingomonas fennica]